MKIIQINIFIVIFSICYLGTYAQESEVKTLLDSSQYYFETGNEQSLIFANKAYDLSIATNDTLGIIQSLIKIARNNYDNGNFPDAIKKGYHSLDLARNIKNYSGKIGALSLLGKIHYKNKEFEKAQLLTRESIQLSKTRNDSAVLAVQYELYSSLSRNLGFMDSSLFFTNKAIKINKAKNNLRALSFTYNNLGIYHYKLKNLDSSLFYFNESLSLRKQLNDHKNSIQSINNIGFINFELGNNEVAIALYKKAIALCRKHNSITYLDLSYENLTEAYEKIGEIEKALEMFKKYQNIKDSITGERTQKAIIEAESKIKRKAELEKTKILETQIISDKQYKEKQYLLIIILIIALIITTFVLKTSKRRALETQFEKQKTKAAKAIIDEQEKIREEIAQELHDGVGGSLAGLKLSLSNLQAESKCPALLEEIEHLEKTYQEIRNISHNLTPISFQKNSFTTTIENYLHRSFPNLEIGACFQCYPKNELDKLEYNQQICVYRIIQELSSNIQKHALATNVNFHLTGHDTYLTIMVEDNGKGFDPKTSKNGIGFENIQKRITLYDGKIEIDSQRGNGSTIIIDIPYKKL